MSDKKSPNYGDVDPNHINKVLRDTFEWYLKNRARHHEPPKPGEPIANEAQTARGGSWTPYTPPRRHPKRQDEQKRQKANEERYRNREANLSPEYKRQRTIEEKKRELYKLEQAVRSERVRIQDEIAIARLDAEIARMSKVLADVKGRYKEL